MGTTSTGGMATGPGVGRSPRRATVVSSTIACFGGYTRAWGCAARRLPQGAARARAAGAKAPPLPPAPPAVAGEAGLRFFARGVLAGRGAAGGGARGQGGHPAAAPAGGTADRRVARRGEHRRKAGTAVRAHAGPA